MPVMINTMTIERGSSCSATGICSAPVGIQSNKVRTYGACIASPAPRIARKMASASPNAVANTPGPISDTHRAAG